MSEVLVRPAVGDWRVTTLGELCRAGGGDIQTGPFGSQLHASDYVPSGIPSVMPQNIGDNVIVEDGIARITSDDAVRLSRYLLREGDIVYSRRGDVERRALVRPEQSGWLCGTGCLRVRLGGAADPRFISYYLGHPSVRAWIVRHAIGATMPNLNTGILEAVPVTLPPRCTQLAIAALLGALDDKIAVNQKLVYTANELMKAMYARAICQGSVTTSIGKVADVFDGPHATPNKTESGPWFLSISSLRGGRLMLRESAHLSNDDFQRWTRRVTPCPGDVLFSYETRLGEAALMPMGVRACLGRRMALLRPRSGAVGSRTLLQAFLSKSFQETIRRQTINGATVDRISLISFPSWPINLPARGTRQLEDILSHLDDLASNSERENEKLDALRDTLLPRLISGEIQIRDAERIVEDAT
jgi:type I restriction enzyme S subunit